MNLPRASGVLLHPTSLPDGTIGSGAHGFINWLADAGQSYWQVLPLIAPGNDGSPYNGLSAMAGNPALIDREGAAEDGASGGPDSEADFERYRAENRAWLDDYALFVVLRGRHGGAPWTDWERDLRLREPQALQRAQTEFREDIRQYEFDQFLFDRQWVRLREHARSRRISIIGDIPIFVAHDSADVWAHRDIFQLATDGHPRVVSGVPPDYFSATGQRWGNPLYDWARLKNTGYAWWIERVRRTLGWVDLVRVDHFRGFEAYWEVPAEEETAINGRWRRGPGRAVFDAIAAELGDLPIIAEDLGLITPAVEKLRNDLGYPGMRVLQFAFDGEVDNPHLPANHPKDAVAFTGTHDNDTVIGWWRSASADERTNALRLIGGAEGELHWEMIELAMGSRASMAIVPAQDLLGLGRAARMNTPGTTVSNWRWRMEEGDLTDGIGARLRDITAASGRLPARPAQHSSD
jgi:4-alpha-glucanotransferase